MVTRGAARNLFTLGRRLRTAAQAAGPLRRGEAPTRTMRAVPAHGTRLGTTALPPATRPSGEPRPERSLP